MNQGTLPAATAPKPRSNGSQKSNRHRKSNAEKAASEQEHLSLVLTAAETAVNILRQNNLPAAIFGSLACKLYGNSRCPKDADILVLTSASDITAEILKQLLVAAAPRLFLPQELPRHPGPGPMSLPLIPLPRIRWVSGLPLAPFCFILLHKLKGWADHRDAPEVFKRARQSTDAADVRRLLDIVTEMRALQAAPSWKEDLELFDAELQADSVVRVQQYCVEFPGRAKRWRSLGFDVPEPEAAPADPKVDISVALDRLNL
ncbi:hypothetical protein B0H14DRAFT_2788437 [Mycena olivaceomarginata]|nr:hypothetical protein B0H14DRAFT_2788437 [Mycena olivaceomarginata]